MLRGRGGSLQPCSAGGRRASHSDRRGRWRARAADLLGLLRRNEGDLLQTALVNASPW